ncbi:MAG TPA: hypothetical protein DDW50_22860 [Firmicutes bacterium]|jgi:hypothetical protein|nr:hypothetical protein [Bacillota bacterium]
MSMNICGYKFDGPFSVETTIVPVNRAAVYVIVHNEPDGQAYITDVGLSNEQYWDRNNYDGAVSIYLRHMPSTEGYTSQDRQTLERKIRDYYNLP